MRMWVRLLILNRLFLLSIDLRKSQSSSISSSLAGVDTRQFQVTCKRVQSGGLVIWQTVSSGLVSI